MEPTPGFFACMYAADVLSSYVQRLGANVLFPLPQEVEDVFEVVKQLELDENPEKIGSPSLFAGVNIFCSRTIPSTNN